MQMKEKHTGSGKWEGRSESVMNIYWTMLSLKRFQLDLFANTLGRSTSLFLMKSDKINS